MYWTVALLQLAARMKVRYQQAYIVTRGAVSNCWREKPQWTQNGTMFVDLDWRI